MSSTDIGISQEIFVFVISGNKKKDCMLLTVIDLLKVVLINVIAILFILQKIGYVSLLKITVFLK